MPRSLSSELWTQMRSRATAAVLLLACLLCFNLALHMLTPYAGLSSHLTAKTEFTAVGTEERDYLSTSNSVSPTSRRIASTSNQQTNCDNGPCCGGLNPCSDPSFQRSHHFLFGYGSLISTRSRRMTHQTGAAIPVVVRGFQRSWSYAQMERKMTAVGAVSDPRASINGVLVRVPASSLPLFDAREKRYTRVEVPHDSISVFKATPTVAELNLQPTDKVWIYLVDDAVQPTHELPIAQSYVDVVLSGCLEHGPDFAKQCVVGTSQWSDPSKPTVPVWLNDRRHPRIYTTNFFSVNKQNKIDQLLQETIPQILATRRDEATWDATAAPTPASTAAKA